jgi:hypothetical protein
MPLYRVLYLKDQAAMDRFRALPPPNGPANIKAKDYVPACEIEAPNEYAAWRMLQGEGARERDLRPMGVGDVLEAIVPDAIIPDAPGKPPDAPGKPRVCRYVGFDDAVWFVFEPREKKAAAVAEAVLV